MMFPRGPELYRTLADRLARPMVILSFLFIVVLAAALQRAASSVQSSASADLAVLQTLLLALVLLWPLFFVEALAQYLALDRAARTRQRLGSAALTALCPPLRLGARSALQGDRIWLPGLGWQEVDTRLRHRLERLFSVPMILIALMILPVLVIEYRWSELILQHPELAFLLDLCTAVIWLAFTVEFILMCSIAADRLAYCRKHWLDLAIILLPLISFLRFARVLRLGRLARLKQLSTLGRAYRLRGVVMRAHRGIIALDLIDRLLRRSTEQRLERLQADLAAREAEVQALRRKIAALEAEVTRPGTQNGSAIGSSEPSDGRSQVAGRR